jgi:hypothetical protein
MAGVGDARHTGRPGGHPGEEPADRHMRVHEVRPLRPEQRNERGKGTQMRPGRQGPLERQRHDAETLVTYRGQQRPLGAGPDRLVAPRPRLPHQRQKKLPQREIDVGNLDDLQGSDQ